MSKELYKEYLEILTEWVEGRGYHVDFQKGGDNCICQITKIIEINSSASLEKQVYCLLHECGHALIFDNGSFWEYDKKNLLQNKETSLNKVYTVIEETEAWERAFKLATRLKIPIDKQKWENEVIDAMKKYIKWASN